MSADYVEKNIKAFYKLRQAEHRYASFDFCYNYFQSFEDKSQLSRKGNIQMSCLQLGFYLASWGMFRMSGYLGSNKSIKFFEETIFLISRSDNDIILDFYSGKNSTLRYPKAKIIDMYGFIEGLK